MPSIITPFSIWLNIGLWKNFLFFKELVLIAFQKATGRPMTVNDRNFPFEQLTQILGTLPEINILGIKPTQALWDTFNAKSIQLFWDDLPRPVYNTTTPYRRADGAFNSTLYPQMGAANTYYARTVNSKRHQPSRPLPTADSLFTVLLSRQKQNKFIPHPQNITCGLFYFATLITHDLFHSDPKDSLKNTTTSYLDLSPLYGNNLNEQSRVRTFEDGEIKPDSFADMRIALQPTGVIALLVLFSRNHNKIARTLIANNENGRFVKTDPQTQKPLVDDEAVFQIARLVNGACYINIVLHNYLRAILGLPAETNYTLEALTPKIPDNSSGGNQVSIEFNMIYRWHSTIGEKDAAWIESIMPTAMEYVYSLSQRPTTKDGEPASEESYEAANRQKLIKFVSDLVATGKVRDKKALEQWEVGLCEKEGYWLVPGIARQKNGTFRDEDIAKWLKHGFNEPAAAYGANQIPECMRFIEKAGIMQGRKAGICTLNEFRERFQLKKYSTFAEMTSDKDVQKHLQEFYGDVDSVELYPGIVVEEPKSQGLCVNYTISRAILADASNLLRNDRFLNEMRSPNHLTQWGWDLQAGISSKLRLPTYGRCLDEMLVDLVGKNFKQDERCVYSPFKLMK